jgi:hypothetical protein
MGCKRQGREESYTLLVLAIRLIYWFSLLAQFLGAGALRVDRFLGTMSARDKR